MDDFIFDTSTRHLLFSLVGLTFLLAFTGMVLALGEKTFGFSIKRFLDNVEKVAKLAGEGSPHGSLWPGTILLLAGIASATYIAGQLIS